MPKSFPELSTASDAELAKQVAAGDRAAGEALVQRHERVVRSFLRRICFDASLVDDLAQETFLRLLRYADHYDPAYPMRTWLLTIARRLSITAGQKKLRLSTPEAWAELAPPSAHTEPALDRQDRLEHANRLLTQAMRRLSEPQRVALTLFYQQNMPIEEMGKVMEMPASTVKSHLHRARAALQTSLSPHAEEFMP